jgi:hypothetical protein
MRTALPLDQGPHGAEILRLLYAWRPPLRGSAERFRKPMLQRRVDPR